LWRCTPHLRGSQCSGRFRLVKTDYQIVQLKNGSWSVRSLAHGETFHPVIGPQAEAEALYAKQLNLPEILQQKGELTVWDVGLGAAANPIAVLNAVTGCEGLVRILSFDQTIEPLEVALAHPELLGYLPPYAGILGDLLRAGRVRAKLKHTELDWQFILGDFPSFLTQPAATELPKPDVILYDAFSPARNPAMWTYPVFKQLYQMLDPEKPCVMPTYSRSTMLRVTLLLAGFYVGAGHATGEKEETTIAANSAELIKEPLGLRWLERARISKSAEPLWGPLYRQAHLSAESWQRLTSHPQFKT
jgi:hypothetical protein